MPASRADLFAMVERLRIRTTPVVNDSQGRVSVILDEPLLRHAKLNFHPLENTATTTILREDFLRFLGAVGHTPRILTVSGAALGG
jgi:Ala-tRNA(Pro) deacylase